MKPVYIGVGLLIGFICCGVGLGIGVLIGQATEGDDASQEIGTPSSVLNTPTGSSSDVSQEGDDASQEDGPLVQQGWPSAMQRGAYPFNKKTPINTIEATQLGWVKSTGDACVPSLGEIWRYKNQTSKDTSAALYFTPDVGRFAGVVSGIEVDYYGYIESKLVGTYFSEQKVSPSNETYHSLSIALRNSKNICNFTTPFASSDEKYVAISPDLVNKLVPLNNPSSELQKNWKEGSCLPNMGWHWFQDVIGAADLTYKAENTVPIVPMYDPEDGHLTGVFFLATDSKQNWIQDCPSTNCIPGSYNWTCSPIPAAGGEGLNCAGCDYNCAVDAANFWDASPGLQMGPARSAPFVMCTNLCDSACNFTGSGSTPGVFNSMHWFFENPEVIKGCPSDFCTK